MSSARVGLRDPRPVTVFIPGGEVRAVENELEEAAGRDRDKCWGYFPSLRRPSGVSDDLPASRSLAGLVPQLFVQGATFSFCFLRLSLVQQSTEPSYHLDSDAATAVTGDPATIGRRRVYRLLLNLSSRRSRSLHYLSADSNSIDLVAEGSYVTAAAAEHLRHTARVADIPSRRGSTVHGLVFESSRLLHSGLDDDDGHFVAAYGFEVDERSTR